MLLDYILLVQHNKHFFFFGHTSKSYFLKQFKGQFKYIEILYQIVKEIKVELSAL